MRPGIELKWVHRNRLPPHQLHHYHRIPMVGSDNNHILPLFPIQHYCKASCIINLSPTISNKVSSKRDAKEISHTEFVLVEGSFAWLEPKIHFGYFWIWSKSRKNGFSLKIHDKYQNERSLPNTFWTLVSSTCLIDIRILNAISFSDLLEMLYPKLQGKSDLIRMLINTYRQIQQEAFGIVLINKQNKVIWTDLSSIFI